MDNREIERALMGISDKLDRLDARLKQIDLQMVKLEQKTIELRGGIKLAKALVE